MRKCIAYARSDNEDGELYKCLLLGSVEATCNGEHCKCMDREMCGISLLAFMSLMVAMLNAENGLTPNDLYLRMLKDYAILNSDNKALQEIVNEEFKGEQK